uniref:Uncharacterized protein n=1 Tax=Octopus bimaculoides TaxID=37653 RepID=A0A0L8G9B0_OCTBM
MIKFDVNKSVFLTLLYGAGCWTLYRKHINQLDTFHMRCLPTISNTKLSDHFHNSIEAIVIKIHVISHKVHWKAALSFKGKLKDNLKR